PPCFRRRRRRRWRRCSVHAAVGSTKSCKTDVWEWRRAKRPLGWANGGSPITKETHNEGGSNPLTDFIGRESVQLERAGAARSKEDVPSYRRTTQHGVWMSSEKSCIARKRARSLSLESPRMRFQAPGRMADM